MSDSYSADDPYALNQEAERQRRRAMLHEAHIKPLAQYVRYVQKQVGAAYKLPDFDPCDGGINAKALFLLETPGRKAHGSTFVSRNNPDPTARNLCQLLAEAGIPRGDTIIWNIVPWYIGTETNIRPAGTRHIQEAMPYTLGLLRLLPHLRVLVLVGKKAQSAAATFRTHTHLPLIETPHMSATNLNTRPDMRAAILAHFRQVGAL